MFLNWISSLFCIVIEVNTNFLCIGTLSLSLSPSPLYSLSRIERLLCFQSYTSVNKIEESHTCHYSFICWSVARVQRGPTHARKAPTAARVLDLYLLKNTNNLLLFVRHSIKSLAEVLVQSLKAEVLLCQRYSYSECELWTVRILNKSKKFY